MSVFHTFRWMARRGLLKASIMMKVEGGGGERDGGIKIFF